LYSGTGAVSIWLIFTEFLKSHYEGPNCIKKEILESGKLLILINSVLLDHILDYWV